MTKRKIYTYTLICLVICIIGAFGWWSYISTTSQLSKANREIIDLQENINITQDELNEANKTIEDLKNDEYELVYLGEYKITYYCDERHSHVCGGTGVTKSGKPTEVGVTAGADLSILPIGSQVYIQGIGFREIQNTGSGVGGNHIDVLVSTHDEAINKGVKNDGVWLLIKK